MTAFYPVAGRGSNVPAPLFYSLTGDVMLNGPRPSFIPAESHGALLHELTDRITAASCAGDSAAARVASRTAVAFIDARLQANAYRRRVGLAPLASLAVVLSA